MIDRPFIHADDRGAPNEVHGRPMPVPGSIWVDPLNVPYVVKEVSHAWVKCRSKGREEMIMLGDFVGEMVPVEDMLEVLNG